MMQILHKSRQLFFLLCQDTQISANLPTFCLESKSVKQLFPFIALH
jgi:hypothetical protein